MKVAFYAPLKSPNHPNPSGDRLIARLLMQALQHAGFKVRLVSEFRSREGQGEPSYQQRMIKIGGYLAQRLLRQWQRENYQPDFWFTYHMYYKAPDLLGPHMTKVLQIPYWLAEASWADKRANGPWALFHEQVYLALQQASGVFTLNPVDQAALTRVLKPQTLQVRLVPFLDMRALPVKTGFNKPTKLANPIKLVTVAMMRFGDKLASYRLLAAALAELKVSFSLDVIGDGEARAEVEKLFASYSQVHFHGRLQQTEVLKVLSSCDLHVWPAVNEAFGMALLEAQYQQVAIFSGNEGGVSSVMQDGLTGELVAAGNAGQFGKALQALLLQPERLLYYRQQARDYVLGKHDIDQAADVLRTHLLEKAD